MCESCNLFLKLCNTLDFKDIYLCLDVKINPLTKNKKNENKTTSNINCSFSVFNAERQFRTIN